MLMDWIGTSSCEVAADQEWSYVSGRLDNKSGITTCYPEYIVTSLLRGLPEGRNQSTEVIFSVPSGAI